MLAYIHIYLCMSVNNEKCVKVTELLMLVAYYDKGK